MLEKLKLELGPLLELAPVVVELLLELAPLLELALVAIELLLGLGALLELAPAAVYVLERLVPISLNSLLRGLLAMIASNLSDKSDK